MRKILLILGVLILLSSFVSGFTPTPSSNPFGAEEGWDADDTNASNIGKGEFGISACSYNADTPFDDGKSVYCDGTGGEFLDTRWFNFSAWEDISVSFWFKSISVSDDERILGIADATGGAYFSIQTDIANSALIFHGSNGANDNRFPHSDYADEIHGTGKWRLLIYTHEAGSDQTKIHLYYNGSNEVTYASGSDEADGDLAGQYSLYLLADNNNGAGDVKNLEGLVDDVYIYKGVLTPAQMDTIYEGNWSGGAPPPTPTGINVTITQPVEGSAFGIEQLIANNSIISLNVTHNETDLVTCDINTSEWSLISNTSTIWHFENNTNLSTGKYSIFTYCNKTGTTNGTDSVNFHFDIISPLITPHAGLGANGSIVWNGTLSSYIDFYDDYEIYSINITFSNGTIMFNASDMGVTSYRYNISYGVSPTVVDYIDVRLCDSHTDNNIKDLDVKYEDYGVKYIMEKELIFFDKEWVHIYPKTPAVTLGPGTYKTADRYAFILPRSSVYVVESSHFIDIPKTQKFPGHLVIPNIGANGYWVDLATTGGKDYKIKRISNTKVEVTIGGLVGDMITFNSIGELNCIEDRFYWNNINPVIGYTNETTTGTSNDFYLNITNHDTFVISYLTFLWYNNTPSLGDASPNTTISATAPAVGGLYENINWRFIMGINEVGYNLSLNTQTVHNIFIDNCTNSSFYNALDGYFLDIDTGNPEYVNATISITGDATWSGQMNNISEFNLCIYPDFINLSIDLEVQFWSEDNTQYYNNAFNLSNVTRTTLNLYVQDGTSTTTFTLKDKDTQELLNDVYITMYREIDATWTIMESLYSDITGRVRFDYVPEIEYKFLLTKDNYQSYVFYLNPILFSEYDILLVKDITINQSQDYDKVALYYYPEIFYDGIENNFTFMIHSPYDELLGYGYTLTYPGGTTTESGGGISGAQLMSNFTITGAESYDRLQLDYYYYTEVAGYRNFTYYYAIVVGNNTLMSNRDVTYGMGLLERILISVLIVMLVVGVASLVGQPLAGGTLGLLMFGFLSYIGFIPLWAVLLPIAIGLIFIGGDRNG